MEVKEPKSEAFKRLATKRTNRILKDISLLGNLSDKRNYHYDDSQVNKIFRAIEEELRQARARFRAGLRSRRKINL